MAKRPWKTRYESTRFLRVPDRYWAEVQLGNRREFRISHRAITAPQSLAPPCLVVCWREVAGQYEGVVMVLERCWFERLGEISEDSLEAEGFVGTYAMQEFRQEWSERTHKRFDYMLPVWVFRVRPLEEGEFAKLAFLHLTRLYGEHLPEEAWDEAGEYSEALLFHGRVNRETLA